METGLRSEIIHAIHLLVEQLAVIHVLCNWA